VGQLDLPLQAMRGLVAVWRTVRRRSPVWAAAMMALAVVGHDAPAAVWPAIDRALPARAAEVPAVLGSLAADQATPTLRLPRGLDVASGGRVDVPVVFESGGASISSVILSIDYDETLLTIDPTDANGDSRPDAVVFHLPPGFMSSVSLDPADIDGELDVFVAYAAVPLTGLPDGVLMSVTMDAQEVVSDTEARLAFSGDPSPSFGDTSGQSVSGHAEDGSIWILGGWREVFLPAAFVDPGGAVR
jgi:hypothetical protein